MKNQYTVGLLAIMLQVGCDSKVNHSGEEIFGDVKTALYIKMDPVEAHMIEDNRLVPYSVMFDPIILSTESFSCEDYKRGLRIREEKSRAIIEAATAGDISLAGPEIKEFFEIAQNEEFNPRKQLSIVALAEGELQEGEVDAFAVLYDRKERCAPSWDVELNQIITSGCDESQFRVDMFDGTLSIDSTFGRIQGNFFGTLDSTEDDENIDVSFSLSTCVVDAPEYYFFGE